MTTMYAPVSINVVNTLINEVASELINNGECAVETANDEKHIFVRREGVVYYYQDNNETDIRWFEFIAENAFNVKGIVADCLLNVGAVYYEICTYYVDTNTAFRSGYFSTKIDYFFDGEFHEIPNEDALDEEQLHFNETELEHISRLFYEDALDEIDAK